jgi:sugar/nucleoside kinase (ribokinase family)
VRGKIYFTTVEREHLVLLPQVKPFAGIIEIGTPVQKRFGISAIATARELCPVETVLLTHGSGPSLHTRSGATVSVGIARAARPIVDTMGAGDATLAMVIAFILRQGSPESAEVWRHCLEEAMQVAAATCAEAGGGLRLPAAPLLARGGQECGGQE